MTPEEIIQFYEETLPAELKRAEQELVGIKAEIRAYRQILQSPFTATRISIAKADLVDQKKEESCARCGKTGVPISVAVSPDSIAAKANPAMADKLVCRECALGMFGV